MNKTIAGLAAGAALVFAFAVPASAQTVTVAQLQAQIQALMAQLSAMQGGSSTASTGYTFNADLTVGSTGADVTALQNLLISKGFLTMPAGVAEGYFGALTQSAVAKWQASAGISPAAGYFGPKSRAAVNAMGGSTTTTTTTTTSTGTTSTVGSITTPGAEGVLSVTAGPISNSVVNVGQQKVPVLTVRAQAQDSDIAIQRITVDLGTSTNIYNKVFQTLYVIDPTTGAVLTSEPLNSSNVVQSGSKYVATLTGFSAVVPKGTYKDLQVAADLYSSVNTPYLGSYTISVDSNGVRGIDGAGIDQYGPASTISQSITVNASLTDNSIANVNTDSATPQTNSVPVTDTTNGNYLQLPVLTFDVGAQNDSLHLHNLAVSFVTSGTGSASAAYLYNGSTLVTSAAISNGLAIFSNIQDGTAGANIPVNTSVPFTVKADVTGVTSGTFNITASTTGSTNTTIYNSQDGTVNALNGIAAGNTLTVLGKGPAFTINSATIAASGANQSGSTNATSTITATFSIGVQAIGTNVYFGNQASTTHPMFRFKVLNAAGSDITGTIGSGGGVVTATSSGFIVPTGTGFLTTGQGTNSFELPQQQTGTLSNITYTFAGKDSTGAVLAGGPFSVQISQIDSSNDNGVTYSPQTYMNGLTSWRTPSLNVN